MNTRLLAIDVDHTLLDNNRKLVAANIPAVQRAVDAGILVVLASGRFLPTMRGFHQQLGLTGPLIANGSVVYDSDESILESSFVDPRVFDAVLQFARANDAHLNVYTLDELLFVNSGAWGEKYLQRVHSIAPSFRDPTEVRNLSILKLLLADDASRIETFRQQVTVELEGLPVAITESEAEYLEFLSPVVSKGKALQFLAAHLGIPQEQTAAIGDYLNDVEMVEWAGFGGAVANGRDEVKAVADVIVASNQEAGVAEFIDLILR